ncbi:MAG: response regulator, partial [Actinobacteria bacterium]|nr:response regulator [Actinomycetota bacterium]
IVQRAGGDISIYSEPGIGTTFKIFLPACDISVRVAGPSADEPASVAGRGERILVVEDERPVVELITRILKEAGYDPIAMPSPQMALDYLEDDATVQLLLTDVIMPEMSGRTLSELTTLPTVFMSGYTDSVIAQQGVLQEGVVFLPKPFSADELLHIIRATLDQHSRIDLREAERRA